jgi:hypothetical protein
VIFSLEFPNQLFPYDVLNAELLRVQERIRWMNELFSEKPSLD